MMSSSICFVLILIHEEEALMEQNDIEGMELLEMHQVERVIETTEGMDLFEMHEEVQFSEG